MNMIRKVPRRTRLTFMRTLLLPTTRERERLEREGLLEVDAGKEKGDKGKGKGDALRSPINLLPVSLNESE